MEENNKSFFKKIANLIVNKRNLFFLLYLFALIFCVFSMNWVQVENDVTTYLSEETETRQGLNVMNDNFTTFATAQLLVPNITLEHAEEIYSLLNEIEGVSMVTFDKTSEHYRNATAFYEVSFQGGNFDAVSLNALEQIETELSIYQPSIYTVVGYDENQVLKDEMMTILCVAVVIIVAVLMLTSQAYMEVPVLLITFASAALLNMGTNYLLGKISFISDSIAVVLQLALAIDYAIILCHRFSDEHKTKDAKSAAIDALTKGIPEIGASSLTTISGLAALAFMEFGIGLDMAVVLIKAILFSLLSVFTLMPGLLVIFSPWIDKTKHRKLLPNISFVGKFAWKSRFILPICFVLVISGAFYLSNQCPYAYSYNDLKTSKMTERQEAYFKIQEQFGINNMIAIIVPSGHYEEEQILVNQLQKMDEVKSVTGLSNMEFMEGYTLTQSVNPREFSELFDMDVEVIQLLYSTYAAEHNEYGAIVNGLNDYEIPLFDLFVFLKDQLKNHNISLNGEDQIMMDEMFEQLELAQMQLQNENYSRLVVLLNLPEEGETTYSFLDEIRKITGQFYEEDYYVIGNSSSSQDLASSFVSDNLLISILSAFFVILVLLFTFQSVALPVLLIVVIQGSIWINFSFPALFQQPLYFLGYLVVNAIMMGANIDYAIVISSYYQEQREHHSVQEAIISAMNSAFPTVFTSGTILASAGLLIGKLSAQPVISTMGVCLGRGTMISIVLVLLVLPSILVLGDWLIEKSSFSMNKIELMKKQASGTLRVSGHIRGYVQGYIDAEMNGLIHGEMDTVLSTSGVVKGEGDEQNEKEH